MNSVLNISVVLLVACLAIPSAGFAQSERPTRKEAYGILVSSGNESNLRRFFNYTLHLAIDLTKQDYKAKNVSMPPGYWQNLTKAKKPTFDKLYNKSVNRTIGILQDGLTKKDIQRLQELMKDPTVQKLVQMNKSADFDAVGREMANEVFQSVVRIIGADGTAYRNK